MKEVTGTGNGIILSTREVGLAIPQKHLTLLFNQEKHELNVLMGKGRVQPFLKNLDSLQFFGQKNAGFYVAAHVPCGMTLSNFSIMTPEQYRGNIG